jgi:hypothetical protein
MTHDLPEPLTILRLRGSHAEMGRQMGELSRDLGGAERTLEFYEQMASQMLSLAIPRAVRPAARRLLQRGLGVGARKLDRARRRRFPEYAARTDALFRAVGIAPGQEYSINVMDVLQNTVGALGRLRLLETTGLSVAAVPACTSLAVWGDASSDGAMRHARNFDFPGAGIWDRTPTVVFCEPDEGLRYGYVTTRGADVPGVTAFNEAGLSVTAHTRFHRDVNFHGVSVVDFGHEIIRRCRTLADVREVVGQMQTASTWGFLVSSAHEGAAMVVETTGKTHAFTMVAPGRNHLACTNRYMAAELTAGEVTSSPSFAVDSDARFQRADEAVARAGGALGRADLQRVLGDCGDPGAPDADADDRLAGNCISTPMTVKSVIFEPQSQRVRVSTGAAPTGLGPWVDVPYAWDGPVGHVPAPSPTDEDTRPSDPNADAAVRHYVAGTRAHLAGAPGAEVRAELEAAVRKAPTEPNLRFLAAIFAVAAGDFADAVTHLDRALQRERGTYRRALLLLWHGRVLAATGRRLDAQRSWRELSGLGDAPGVDRLRAAAARETRRPLPRLRLRTVVPDVFLVDATVPGV